MKLQLMIEVNGKTKRTKPIEKNNEPQWSGEMFQRTSKKQDSCMGSAQCSVQLIELIEYLDAFLLHSGAFRLLAMR